MQISKQFLVFAVGSLSLVQQSLAGYAIVDLYDYTGNGCNGCSAYVAGVNIPCSDDVSVQSPERKSLTPPDLLPENC